MFFVCVYSGFCLGKFSCSDNDKLVFLNRWTRVGLGLVVSLVVGCLVANAVIEAHWGLPIAMFQE